MKRRKPSRKRISERENCRHMDTCLVEQEKATKKGIASSTIRFYCTGFLLHFLSTFNYLSSAIMSHYLVAFKSVLRIYLQRTRVYHWSVWRGFYAVSYPKIHASKRSKCFQGLSAFFAPSLDVFMPFFCLWRFFFLKNFWFSG